MVVRYIISGVLNRVPIVNHFTRQTNTSNPSTPKHLVTSSSSSDEEFYDYEDQEEDEFEDEDEIKPINIQTLSPKDKIHSKLINNRTTSSPIPEMSLQQPSSTISQDETEIIFDSPTRKRVSAIDKSNILPVSSRLNKRKNNKTTKFETPFDSTTTTTTSIGGDSIYASAVQTSSETEEDLEDSKVQQYLDDQNSKFNDLISNNIDVVLNEESINNQSQSPSTPTQVLLKMAYDNRGAIANSLFQYGKQRISSKLPYIPYFNPKTNTQDDQDNTPRLEELNSFTTPKLGSPLLDSNSELIRYAGDLEEGQKLTEQNLMDQQHFDHLMSNLDDEVKIDIFLDSLDRETKLNLYQSLRKDLNILGDDSTPGENIRSIYYDSNMSTLDKIQMFIIVSIKLFMTGIKLFIPITKYMIYKFQKNDFFIFNSKNCNKFIDFILKFMNYIDLKLNSNEQIIDKISNHDYIQTEEHFEEMINDFTIRTKQMFKPTYIKDRLISKDDYFKRGLYDYLISSSGYSNSNFDTTSSKNYENDPRYAIYYKQNQKDDYSNNGNLNSNIEMKKIIKTKKSNPNLYRSNSPVKNKSQSVNSNDENISFMEVADKFIEQLETGV
ncbi:hypothetical protein KGF54_002096 [Candida jiufengensis]|uniref:uncharacterized protein n=1 Tax=Candida jiufengensis TaxID=497108 RepID=UPI0022259B0D|nr:uncharacterized protein KGF54_002096 [Candida jiufengensis]KAI5954321.1 hypothetical protein KGF54_002096 [Candida jiufengensis]